MDEKQRVMEEQREALRGAVRRMRRFWAPGSGRTGGKRPPKNWRLALRRRRKRERQARRFARACAGGRKHRG